jgi:hypothetical protein
MRNGDQSLCGIRQGAARPAGEQAERSRDLGEWFEVFD